MPVPYKRNQLGGKMNYCQMLLIYLNRHHQNLSIKQVSIRFNGKNHIMIILSVMKDR